MRIHIQGNNISVDANVANNQAISGATPNEGFIIYLAISGASTVNVVLDNGVGGSGIKWATGKFSYTITATRLSETENYVWYDVVMDGVIPHGSAPYIAGNTWGPARLNDKEMGFAVSGVNLPITACEEPPASSTSSSSTTSSTVSPTVAPTSIVSTTVADTLPNTGPNDELKEFGVAGFALMLLGIVALSGAAVLGQHRRRDY